LLEPPKPPELPPEEPDMPEPEEPDEPDVPEEPGDLERLVSPASSSEVDGVRLPLEALRELPSPGEASSRIPSFDEEPDCPGRPDEADFGSLCEPDRPDDPLIPPWFTFDEPEFLSRSVIWRTSFD
jgi:hypothetical protein